MDHNNADVSVVPALTKPGYRHLGRYKRTQTRWKRYEKQRPGHQLQVDADIP